MSKHNSLNPINADEYERRMIDAAEAIRKNNERGRTLKLNLERKLSERRKAILLPATFDEEEEEELENDPF